MDEGANQLKDRMYISCILEINASLKNRSEIEIDNFLLRNDSKIKMAVDDLYDFLMAIGKHTWDKYLVREFLSDHVDGLDF